MDGVAATALGILICVVPGIIAQPTAEREERSKSLSILLLSLPLSGHLSVPVALGEELVRRGHRVTLCTTSVEGLPNKAESMATRAGINYMSAGKTSVSIAQIVTDLEQRSRIYNSVYLQVRTLLDSIAMESKTIATFLQSGNHSLDQWDMIIATTLLTPYLSCVHHHTKIPSILLSITLQFQPHTLPPWPFPGTFMGDTGDNMSFKERFLNSQFGIILNLLMKHVFMRNAKNALGHLCEKTTLEYMSAAPSQYYPQIVPTSIGFEFSRLVQPLTEYVGPILGQSVDPIPDDMLSWLDSKQDRTVIYVSMGSLINLSTSTGRAIAEGVMNTNYSTLWSLQESNRGFLSKLKIDPNQVHLSAWTPQLSVLRHSAIGMSIVHGGVNGINEVLANGIPLIVLPNNGEQFVMAAE